MESKILGDSYVTWNPGLYFDILQVKWRPVIVGLLLQFIFAYLILRTCVGYLTFKWMGDRIQEFLTHTDAGAEFVFGSKYTDHFFAFKVRHQIGDLAIISIG